MQASQFSVCTWSALPKTQRFPSAALDRLLQLRIYMQLCWSSRRLM